MRPPHLLVGYKKLLLARPSLLRVRQRASSGEATASSGWYRKLLPARPSLLPEIRKFPVIIVIFFR
jgi:hypothetical protein